MNVCIEINTRMNRNMKKTILFLWGIVTMLSLDAKAPSYTVADIWKAYEGFNRVFLDSQKYIYRTDSSFPHAVDRWNGAAAIWCQPMYWDMAMNAYRLARQQNDRKREREYAALSHKIFEGNKAQYCGFDFHDNNENTGWFIYDDIQWWTITLARAYALFGDKEYLELSEASFSRVWYGSERVGDTGSYDEKKGGMFWQWQPIQHPAPNDSERDGKMACINFPTVVAAMELYANVPADRADQRGGVLRCQSKGQYLQKAKEIYAWGVDHLFDKKTGRVADSQHGEHEPNWKVHVYNQATFIGASVMLYKATGRRDYLDNAVLAADYTVRDMSPEGVLPFESGIEQGIYTAIFAQYMALLVYDCGQSQYIPFLEHNIACGWANRDKTRDICGGKYDEPLQGDEVVDSYSASGIPALMLLFPGGE